MATAFVRPVAPRLAVPFRLKFRRAFFDPAGGYRSPTHVTTPEPGRRCPAPLQLRVMGADQLGRYRQGMKTS